MEITIKDIEKNLQSLPKEFLNQVNDYVEFLMEISSNQKVPEWQKDEVMRRIKEAEENPEVMKPIDDLYKLLDEK